MKREALSAISRVRDRMQSLPRKLNLHGSEGPGIRRVIVLEAAGEGEWKAVEADVSGEGVKVLKAGAVDKAGRCSGNSGAADLAQLANGSSAILVTNSRKSVCRSLDLVNASPDETKRMVALRLETELPYPVDESVWVFDRQQSNGGPAGATIVLATVAADVTQAEEQLHARGIRCAGVEFGVAGLAELAVTSHADETLAVVNIEGSEITFAITHGGSLRYVRHLPVAPDSPDSTWVSRVAGELNQSIYDYVLRANNGKPTRVVVAGAGVSNTALLEGLREALGIPVEPARRPGCVVESEGCSVNGDLVEDYPACLGVLVALHRRMRGERTAAPALRARRAGFEGIDLSGKRSVLAITVAALFLVWIALLFGVRSARMNAAEHVIEESKASLERLEQLQDEVDILQFEGRRQRSTLDALLALSEALPGEIKIEKLTIDPKGVITIRGTTGSVEIASQKAIAALEQSAAFAKPKFMGASEGKNGFTFGITCEFRGGPVAKAEVGKTEDADKEKREGGEEEAGKGTTDEKGEKKEEAKTEEKSETEDEAKADEKKETKAEANVEDKTEVKAEPKTEEGSEK